MNFDIANLQFVLKEDQHTAEIQPGKTMQVVCCDDTLLCLEGLIPYKPDEMEFLFFEKIFSVPHIFRTGGNLLQILSSDHRTDDFFQKVSKYVNELQRLDLREYFFKCVEIDVKLEQYVNMTGKWRFPIMKFIERLSELRQEVLEESLPDILELEESVKNPDFTTARQVLAVHYLLEYCQVRGIDQTKKADFIEFLTGKNRKNIYDLVRDPLTKKRSKDLRKGDLQYIRTFFENLGLSETVKAIGNELDKPE